MKFYTCLRLKTLKTIPCSAAHTRIGQIRECHPPPPFRPLVLLSRQGRKHPRVFTKKRDTILTLVLTLYERKGYMIYENSCKNRRRLHLCLLQLSYICKFLSFQMDIAVFFNILLIYVNRGPQVKVNITAPVSSLSWSFIYKISKYFQK